MESNFSFNKNERIKKSSEFKRIFRSGKLIRSNSYKIFFVTTQIKPAKIGIVASKRVGNSVRRNYEKRIVREFFRAHKTNNFDIVVVINKKNASFHAKRKDFFSLIQTIKTSA